MQIYLASRYSRAPEMREVRAKLVDLGHKVTSRWIDMPYGDPEPVDGVHRWDRDDACRIAIEDMEDLTASDMVVSFTENIADLKKTSKGGRHVEFGAALAFNKIMIRIGPFENVFHLMPGIDEYDSFDAFLSSHWIVDTEEN